MSGDGFRGSIIEKKKIVLYIAAYFFFFLFFFFPWLMFIGISGDGGVRFFRKEEMVGWGIQ
jgi:hypothetical protein